MSKTSKLSTTYLPKTLTQSMMFGLLSSVLFFQVHSAWTAEKINEKGVVGYYQSWSAQNTQDGTTTDLAQLSSEYTVVNLSFMQPNTTYKSGQETFEGTGLSFSYSPAVLKQAIATLKARNPQTKILVSVGGGGPNAWDRLNTKAIGAFVRDFNLDGVDIDFEVSANNISCDFSQIGGVSCNTDDSYINAIESLRAELPRTEGYVISLAGFSTGAYGERGQLWERANPLGSPFRGITINALKEAGDALDMVFIMAYDADEGYSGYSATEAFDAYQHYFDGPVYLGIEVPPEGWGRHVVTGSMAADLARYVNQNGGAGMMIWGISKINQAHRGVDAQCLTTIMYSELNPDSSLDLREVCPPSETTA